MNDSSYFPILLDFLENAEYDSEEADEDDKKQFEQIQTSISKVIVCATYSGKCLIKVKVHDFI